MKVTDSNRYWLPHDLMPNRFLHLATVEDGVNEYKAFIDSQTMETYIERVAGGHFEYIEDDELAEDLNAFLVNRGLLMMDRPLLPDTEWFKLKD